MAPGYLKLHESGELAERAKLLHQILASCVLCPRKCRVNRLAGERGYCRSGAEVMVSSSGPHFGEEPEIVGRSGSGTIFLTNCSLRCVYCQNYEISHLGHGEELSVGEVADLMLDLQHIGCENVNLVTPTHYAPQLIDAISVAAGKGLRLPIFWNCSGYENVEIIRLLEGVVDIYKPDFKYGDAAPAQRYSNVPDYFERCQEAVKEMHRQVGDLKVDARGVAYRGLLVRHLVLPNNLAGSKKVLEFISKEVSRECYINVMAQYRPCGRAREYEELSRRPTPREYLEVVALAQELRLHRGLSPTYL